MEEWRDVLQLRTSVITKDEVEAQYRRLARLRHPDMGGSNNAMTELNIAKQTALAELERQPVQSTTTSYEYMNAQNPMNSVNGWAAQSQQANWDSMLGGLGNAGGAAYNSDRAEAIASGKNWLNNFFRSK